MADNNKTYGQIFLENLAMLGTLDGIQKYLLGTKKSGQPRAVYDIIRDYTAPKKKKNKNKSGKGGKGSDSTYDFYIKMKKGKKKGHTHWNIDD